jgi:hypothetical protein
MQPQPAKEKNLPNTARTCQALSHLEETCTDLATMHCDKCGQWYCPAHAMDDAWHACELDENADLGGEA